MDGERVGSSAIPIDFRFNNPCTGSSGVRRFRPSLRRDEKDEETKRRERHAREGARDRRGGPRSENAVFARARTTCMTDGGARRRRRECATTTTTTTTTMPGRTRRGVGGNRRKVVVDAPSRRGRDDDSDESESESDSDSGSSTSQVSLFGAIEDGDADAFERILREDAASVTHVNKNGWTAAHQAAYSGEHKMLKRVLELGVDVDARCADGCVAAHYASAQGEKKCLKVLAEAGSNLETKDDDHETPLDVCTQGCRELLADLIIEARAARKK